METKETFYICPVCFNVSEIDDECHGKPMIECDTANLDIDQHKPLMDHQGQLRTRAPRWFLKAKANQPDCMYICLTCFEVSQFPKECHGRPMYACNALNPSDERRKPSTDHAGRPSGRAPRWFLEAIKRKEPR